MRDIMLEAQKYCEEVGQPGDNSLFNAFCAGAGFIVANENDPTSSNQDNNGRADYIKVSWRGNDYEMEYSGQQSLDQIVQVLNQALLIMVQDLNKKPKLITGYEQWLEQNKN